MLHLNNLHSNRNISNVTFGLDICIHLLSAFSKSVLEKLKCISSAENQKGIITIQRCSIENQKGAVAIEFAQR